MFKLLSGSIYKCQSVICTKGKVVLV